MVRGPQSRAVMTITFVDEQRDRAGGEGRSFHVCDYDGVRLPALPWGNDPFDCVLFVAANATAAARLGPLFAAEIVRHAVDYVQTAGPGAEAIHDLIDQASVQAGVQAAIGDGRPMTTWHEDANTPAAGAEVAALCFGGADHVLCVVIGSQQDRLAFAAALRLRLAERD